MFFKVIMFNFTKKDKITIYLFIEISHFNNFILVGCNGQAKQKHQTEETGGKRKKKKRNKEKKI
jgi:hypothetical protein